MPALIGKHKRVYDAGGAAAGSSPDRAGRLQTMTGREPKLDDDRQARILKDLAEGQTRACAAERAGISERTLLRWMARGRKGEEPFLAFMSGVKKAERDAEALAVRSIR